MRWKFSIHEVSASCYQAKAVRNSGNIIEIDCAEAYAPKVLYEAFCMELSLGTLKGEAAYHITHGFKSSWTGRYDDSAFGSWIAGELTSPNYIIYDGKDFTLEIFSPIKSDNSLLWRGHIDELEIEHCPYWRYLFES